MNITQHWLFHGHAPASGVVREVHLTTVKLYWNCCSLDWSVRRFSCEHDCCGAGNVSAAASRDWQSGGGYEQRQSPSSSTAVQSQSAQQENTFRWRWLQDDVISEEDFSILMNWQVRNYDAKFSEFGG